MFVDYDPKLACGSANFGVSGWVSVGVCILDGSIRVNRSKEGNEF